MLCLHEDIDENDRGGCVVDGTVVATVEEAELEELDEPVYPVRRLSGTGREDLK